MSEFIVTLLFGWMGAHKFMQKKYLMGILYLCTLGLCGIGWAIDTISAFIKILPTKHQESGISEKQTIVRGGYSVSACN